MTWWDIVMKVVPQFFAAWSEIKARGGHGTYEFDLDVRDKATGTDVIAGVEVFEVTL